MCDASPDVSGDVTSVRIVLVAGVDPPDVGEPVAHAADLAEALRGRGHAVTVLTLGDPRAPRSDPGTVRLPGTWPRPARQSAVSAWLLRHAGRYDVVYATGLLPAAVAGARMAGRPVVVTVGGLAREQDGRFGSASVDLEAVGSREERGNLRDRARRRVRNATIRAATAVVAPSDRLGATVRDWLGGPAPVHVVHDDRTIEGTADEVEALLARAMRRRPRAVFLGASRVVPADRTLEGRTEVLSRYIRTTIVGIGRPRAGHLGVARTIGFPESSRKAVGRGWFYAAGPLVAVALTAGRRRSAIVCQSPHEAIGTVALARLLPGSVRPRVVVEVHGEWRSSAGSNGGSSEDGRALLTDRVAKAALLRADRVRVVGTFTEGLARQAGWRGELDRFPAFSLYDEFLGSPPVDPPSGPRVLYVGALERAKGIDVLLDAWEDVGRRRPDAVLAVVGDGSLGDEVRARVARLGAGVRLVGAVDRAEVRTLLDRAAVIVVPSRSEALGHVVLEAFARARPVVGTCVGGIPELILEGECGVLVPPGDPPALAAGIVRLLEDPVAATEMGRNARAAVERIDPAAEFDAGIERLARWIDSG